MSREDEHQGHGRRAMKPKPPEREDPLDWNDERQAQERARRSRAATGSERVIHTCVICRHKWQSLDSKTERHVITAAKVNKDGPYCDMCRHLEMAERYALARGFAAIEGGVKKWRVLRGARQAPNT